jgi:hypothetical protein
MFLDSRFSSLQVSDPTVLQRYFKWELKARIEEQFYHTYSDFVLVGVRTS